MPRRYRPKSECPGEDVVTIVGICWSAKHPNKLRVDYWWQQIRLTVDLPLGDVKPESVEENPFWMRDFAAARTATLIERGREATVTRRLVG